MIVYYSFDKDNIIIIIFYVDLACGRPEQPPNSTLLATSLEVGAVIEHRCDSGHLLVGPGSRTCLPNGFYSEFPPVCRCKHTHFIELLIYYKNQTCHELGICESEFDFRS